jgi:hypothetical protein
MASLVLFCVVPTDLTKWLEAGTFAAGRDTAQKIREILGMGVGGSELAAFSFRSRTVFFGELDAELFIGERVHNVSYDLRGVWQRFPSDGCPLLGGLVAALLEFSLSHKPPCAEWTATQSCG